MVLVDGVAAQEVSALDRGLAYGDGLFETIALRDGVPQHWERHLQRLGRGACTLGIEAPCPSLWDSDLKSLISAELPRRAVLKLILTRGNGGRGYAPLPKIKPTRISCRLPWPEWLNDRPSRGARLIRCHTRLALNPALAGFKHLNRLEQVLGAREVAALDADDGIMFSTDGRLIETTRSNVFLVFGEHILTPALDDCGIAGVMRDVLLDVLPNLGFKLEQATLGADALNQCDEIFLTNSLIGLWPVERVEGDQPRIMGPAPTSARLQRVLTELGHLP